MSRIYRFSLGAALLLSLAVCAHIRANDGAASTATGGVRLVHEARISMQKERLSISREKVRVEYEFANYTDSDIQTEVAFPIPEYKFEHEDPGGPRSIDDFKVWVGGKETTYAIEIKARVGGDDVTALLRRYDIDLNSFGHFDWKSDRSPDFAKLPKEAQSELVRAGAFYAGTFPNWTVSKTYYWNQVFPAHATLHVVHEYKPIEGFQLVELSQLDSAHRRSEIDEAKRKLATLATEKQKGYEYAVESFIGMDHLLGDACIDDATRAGITAAVNARKTAPQGKTDSVNDDWLGFQWIDYIVTTANTWKMPIEDFELVVEKPEPKLLQGKSFVTFCWDGPVEKLDGRHFIARAKNFVPKRELHIAFFD